MPLPAARKKFTIGGETYRIMARWPRKEGGMRALFIIDEFSGVSKRDGVFPVFAADRIHSLLQPFLPVVSLWRSAVQQIQLLKAVGAVAEVQGGNGQGADGTGRVP